MSVRLGVAFPDCIRFFLKDPVGVARYWTV